MKISEVRCVEYTGSRPGDKAFWDERLRRPVDVYPEYAARAPQQLRRLDDGTLEVRQLFLHVETSEGITGTTAVLSPEQAHLLRTSVRDVVLGLDPLAVEHVWDVTYRSAIHGRAGIGMLALSALDCALWDIRGQYFGVPAHVLLGGPTRPEVAAYASTLGDRLDPGHVATRTRELRHQGFSGVKWFPRWGPADGHAGVDKIVELVAGAREAGGPDLEIMLDAWNSWDIPFTVAVARETEHLRVRWIEEPLLPDDTAGLTTLRELVGGRTQIAGGEHEYTRWGVARLLRHSPLDLYQPDPHWGGGISEMMRIGALVSAAGRQLIPHGQSMQCNAALTFGASPALIPEMEYLLRLAPLYQHFLAEPIRPDGGAIRAPRSPGLGMRLNEDAIRDIRPLR